MHKSLNMFGLGNMGKMMGQLQEMKKQMDDIKEKLGNISVEGTSNNGEVRVRFNGNRELLEVILSEDFETFSLQDKETAVGLAIQRGLEKAEQVNESEMRGAASSMMPGMMGK